MAPRNTQGSPDQPSPENVSWDMERNIHEFDDFEVHLQGSTVYVPARMKAEMDKDFGGPVPAVKTKTFIDSLKVWIAPTLLSDPAARKLRTSKTLGSAEFGFGIQLRKLGVLVPPGRQLNFKVTKLPDGNKSVYEISFAEYVNKPRDIDLEAIAAAKKAKAEKAKARRAARKAKNTIAPASDTPETT